MAAWRQWCPLDDQRRTWAMDGWMDGKDEQCAGTNACGASNNASAPSRWVAVATEAVRDGVEQRAAATVSAQLRSEVTSVGEPREALASSSWSRSGERRLRREAHVRSHVPRLSRMLADNCDKLDEGYSAQISLSR